MSWLGPLLAVVYAVGFALCWRFTFWWLVIEDGMHKNKDDAMILGFLAALIWPLVWLFAWPRPFKRPQR